MDKSDESNGKRDEFAWKAVSTLSGILGGLIVRKALAALWTRVGSDRHKPPLNPADRDIAWGDAAQWAIAAGVGAGIGRLLSQRFAAAGWEAATGSKPPGIETAD